MKSNTGFITILYGYMCFIFGELQGSGGGSAAKWNDEKSP